MNDERMTMKDFKREARKIKIKRKVDSAKMAVANAGQWVWDHKVEIGAGVTFVVGAVTKLSKVHSKYKSEHTVYDPSLHKRVPLKRKLSKAQNVELFNRMSQGEKKHDILKDMNVVG